MEELTLRPGPRLRGGRYEWDIGTAGPATMLALALLPLAALWVGRTSGGAFSGR